MSTSFENWAKSQLSQLLPLDDESLSQVIQHAQSLPKEAASENLKSLLGDSPKAFEFISSFNLRRPAPSTDASKATNAQNTGSLDEVPKHSARPKGKKKPLNNLPPPRRVEGQGEGIPAHHKRDDFDYVPGKSGSRDPRKQPNTFALQGLPDAKQIPLPARPSSTSDGVATSAVAQLQPTRLPPSAAGPLISDSRKSSRASSPAKTGTSTPRTKVNITGGASMRGASTTVSELDSAIRSLEIQTDPTKATSSDADMKKRKCTCGAQRHALLAAAPNCLSCGKIVCAKEGLGPCTFCGTPLLSNTEIHEMIRVLKEERGKEKQNEHNAAHKRTEVSKAPRAFASSHTNTPGSSMPGSGYASDADGAADKSLDIAKAHRDRLLKFQAENAKRTQIHDEAADFETPDVGLNMWASPVERAQQLKRQQKVLREQEWNARPDYEKRKMIMSLDVSGGKAVRRMQQVSREEAMEGSETDEVDLPETPEDTSHSGAGFARNPLLGELIRPIYDAGGDAKGKGRAREKKSTWRRVQDDNDDNEQYILDGGAYGDNNMTVLSTEEPTCG